MRFSQFRLYTLLFLFLFYYVYEVTKMTLSKFSTILKNIFLYSLCYTYIVHTYICMCVGCYVDGKFYFLQKKKKKRKQTTTIIINFILWVIFFFVLMGGSTIFIYINLCRKPWNDAKISLISMQTNFWFILLFYFVLNFFINKFQFSFLLLQDLCVLLTKEGFTLN